MRDCLTATRRTPTEGRSSRPFVGVRRGARVGNRRHALAAGQSWRAGIGLCVAVEQAIPRLARRFALAALLGLVLTAPPGAAHAQPPDLVSIASSSSSPPIRSDAPMTLLWSIRSQSPSLIEGQLEVTVHDGPTIQARVVVEDIVLSPGEQVFQSVLPAVEADRMQRPLQVHVEFTSKKRKIAGADFEVMAPDQWQRALAILLCEPLRANVARDRQRLADRLRLETCNGSSDRTISTRVSLVRPEDLPADPLGYCGYDVVVLAQDGFADVKESQLRMLLEWVEAGGSLCVVPADRGLREYHAQILNGLAHSPADQPRFTVNPAGRLVIAAENETSATPVLLRRYGLGRVAFLTGALDRLFAEHEIDVRRMLAFLWKVRHDRLEEFMNTGKFSVKSAVPVDQVQPGENEWQNPNVYYQNANYDGLRPKHNQLAQLPLQTGDQLLSRLMPQGLRVVPMSLIGVILVVYVALIGPADWFVLGALRRRKWTWVFFPAVTVALTLATVKLAEWYMQVTGNHRHVTFHDIGEEGQVARRNRYDALFEGSERFIKTELNREIFTAMTLQRFSSGTWAGYQQSQLDEGDQSHKYTGVATYSGRVPAHYAVTQFASQWTPQLNRRFTIPVGNDQPVEFDWSRFADPGVFSPRTVTAEGAPRRQIVQGVQQVFGPAASVHIVTGGKMHHLAGNKAVFQELAAPYGLDPYGNPNTQPQYGRVWTDPSTRQSGFLEDVSSNAQGGLFAVVSQISPTGGKDFEDLALVDPSNPDQWLLIVAIDRGDDLDIYRKLYSGGD
jgi:hypothetical protein